MDRLHFSRRARRRWGQKRVAIAAWVLSLAAVAAGIPLPLVAPRLLDRLSSLPGRPPPALNAGAIETTKSAESALRFRSRIFQARPTPTPTPKRPQSSTSTPSEPSEPTSPPAYSGSVVTAIHAAASEFGLSGNYLLGVAECESGLDPYAYNPAGYHGLFQFDSQTWAAYGYGSIHDPAAQARTAARLLAMGQSERWPNCA